VTNKIDAAYHTPINSFDYQYSEQITHNITLNAIIVIFVDNYDFSLAFDLLQ
jgi:hypothetical protein